MPLKGLCDGDRSEKDDSPGSHRERKDARDMGEEEVEDDLHFQRPERPVHGVDAAEDERVQVEEAREVVTAHARGSEQEACG